MTNYKLELKWAVIFVATLLLWSVLELLLGFHDQRIEHHPIVSMFFMLPAILIYALALKQKKHAYYDGSISFGQAFKSGLIITLLISLVNPGTQWVISYVITPDYFANAIKYTVDNGYDTLENATEFFTYQSYVVQGTLWALIMGIVTTIVVSLILKSKKKA